MAFIPENPIHPVEILTADFMAEYGLSAERMARDIGVDAGRLQALIADRGAIDADLALRLGRYFDTSAEFWMNLQGSYDLALAARSAGDINAIRPVNAA